jgi:sigma-B regulation protein RsbU (phosphoserine phosphatase)
MHKQTITLKNSATESDKLSENLHRFIHSNDISPDIHDDLRLAIEEIFINIISYAYPANKTYNITIEFSHAVSSMNITFTDSGAAFNPLSCTTCSDDLCDGGMGIPLIKSLTDEQSYKRVKQHNVFTVTKHYTKQK